MPLDYPTINVSEEEATKADISGIQIFNTGTGAMDCEFRIDSMFGIVRAELDPNLDPDLDVHLFDRFEGHDRTVLQAKFGPFISALEAAVAAEKITLERALAFATNAPAYFLSGIDLSKEAIALTEICAEEMAAQNIVLNWPERKIRRIVEE
jgi:hypothetical protein